MISRRLFLWGAAALKTGNSGLAAWVLGNARDGETKAVAAAGLTPPATLAVDFSGGSLPAGWAYTGGNGAYTNVSGNLALAATNAARYDYDPTTHAFLGLLIEPASSNQLSNPNTFTNAAWAKLGGGTGSAPTVTGSFATGPDGVSGSASRVQFNKGAGLTSNDYSLLRQGVTLTGALRGHAYIKSNTGSNQTLYAYINTGGAAHQVAVTATTSWQRIACGDTATGVATYLSFGLAGSFGSTATADVLIAFADMKLESADTSYTPGNRAADALSFTVPTGIYQLTYTFDDNSTQTVPVYPGMAYTVPTNLNRPHIKRIDGNGTPVFHYYVDSVGGSDANDGLTINTPKQTLAAINTLIGSQTYRSVGLKRGSTWREEFTIGALDGIMLLAYGSGADPIVRGDDAISAGAWSKSAGLTNVYQASLALTGGLTSGSFFVNVYENGANLVQVASAAACDSTPGSYYIADQTVTPITLQIHASDNGNPASNGKTYEYTNRGSCVNLSGNYCYVEHVQTRRQRGNDGSLRLTGLTCITRRCTVSDGGKHAAYHGPGSTADHNSYANSYYGLNGSENLLVVFAGTADGTKGFTLTNCSFAKNTAITPAATQNGWFSHTGDSSNIGAVAASKNTFSNLTTAYDGTDCPVGTSTGDTFVNCQARAAGLPLADWTFT